MTTSTKNDDNSAVLIGLIQESVLPKVRDQLAKSTLAVREAARRGAKIVCLQELFASPYFCQQEEPKFFELAEDFQGETVSHFRALAAELEVVMIVPFFERRAPGVYHNSAAVIDADGSLLGVYRKMHIPDDPLYLEKFYFTPGDVRSDRGAGYQVFQTRYAKIGVLICWDQWYPEAARITALLGAEILFYPTAIGWHPSEKATLGDAQREAWQAGQRAHAIANGVFVAAANRVGFESAPGTDGLEFFGHSFVYDPFGRMLAQASGDQEEILVVSCERKLIEETRQLWPFLRDRRIDSYQPILSRFLKD